MLIEIKTLAIPSRTPHFFLHARNERHYQELP